MVNELAFDLVDWEFSAFASGYDDYEQQFAYFTSVEAIKKANPAEFEGAGEYGVYINRGHFSARSYTGYSWG